MSGTKRSRDGARSWMEEMTRDKTGPDGERALGKYSLGDECRIDLREREADERKRCGGEGAQRQRHEREDQRLQQSPLQLTHHSKWRVARNATQPARWRTLPSACSKARPIGSPVRVHRAADVRARAGATPASGRSSASLYSGGTSRSFTRKRKSVMIVLRVRTRR